MPIHRNQALRRALAALALLVATVVAAVATAAPVSAAPVSAAPVSAAPQPAPDGQIILKTVPKGSAKAPTGAPSADLGSCSLAQPGVNLVFFCQVLTPSTLLVDCWYFYGYASLPVGLWTVTGTCSPGFYYTHFVY